MKVNRTSFGLLGSFALVVLCALSNVASAAVVSAELAEDTYITEQNPDTNKGTDITLNAGDLAANYNPDDLNRSLVKPDLSIIPGDVLAHDVNQAILYMYFDGYSTWGQNQEVQIFRVLKDWNESQATYNNAASGTAWDTAGLGSGTDYVATLTASATTPASQTGWVAFDVTADVRSFVDGTADNYGWVVMNTSEDNLTDFVRFRSTDYGDSSEHPYLEVTHSIPEPSSAGLLIMALTVLGLRGRKLLA